MADSGAALSFGVDSVDVGTGHVDSVQVDPGQVEAVEVAAVQVDTGEDVVGVRTITNDYYQVGREETRKFAAAVQNIHPFHYDEAAAVAAGHSGMLAPLTFSCVMGSPMEQEDIIEAVPGNYSLSQVLHVEQRIVFHQPLVVGDRVWRVSSIDEFRPGTRADLIVVKNEYVRADGELVQTVWTSVAARSGGGVDPEISEAAERVMVVTPTPAGPTVPADGPDVDGIRAPLLPHHVSDAVKRVDEWQVGQQLDPVTFTIRRGDLVRYSGVAGDPNPIHFSDYMAAKAGLETIVAQAMLSMGFGAGYVAEAVGDPAAVRELRARFTSPIYLHHDAAAQVIFNGKVKSIDVESKQAEVALTPTSGGKRIFGRCTAIVDLR